MLWARAPLFPWKSEPSVFPGSMLSGLSIFNLSRSEWREARGLGPCISQTPLNPNVTAHILHYNGASVFWTLPLEHFCPVPFNSPSEVWAQWGFGCRGGDMLASPMALHGSPGGQPLWETQVPPSEGDGAGGCEQCQHMKAYHAPGPGPRTL